MVYRGPFSTEKPLTFDSGSAHYNIYVNITKCFIYSFVYILTKEVARKMYRRIRDLREDADLRQKDVAAYLNCTQVSYSNYELGKRDIPTDVLIRLAAYYRTSTDYLLGLTEVREPYPRKRGGTGARG